MYLALRITLYTEEEFSAGIFIVNYNKCVVQISLSSTQGNLGEATGNFAVENSF